MAEMSVLDSPLMALHVEPIGMSLPDCIVFLVLEGEIYILADLTTPIGDSTWESILAS